MILDTNALSAFVDGVAQLGTILATQDSAAIPVIVLGEFRYGIMGSKHRKTYEEWLNVHLRHFDILGITAETTLSYALIRAALRSAARSIPANDAWIAALAMQHKMPILSRDEHFDAVSGIRRIGW